MADEGLAVQEKPPFPPPLQGENQRKQFSPSSRHSCEAVLQFIVVVCSRDNNYFTSYSICLLAQLGDSSATVRR